MKRKNLFASAADAINTVITLLMLLLVLALVQSIVIAIVSACTYEKRSSFAQKTPNERNQRIEASQKKFLPDGTIHLVTPEFEHPFSVEEQYMKVHIYDINDNHLWEGIFKDATYNYLPLEKTPQITAGIRDMRNLISYDMLFSRVMEVPVYSGEPVIKGGQRYDRPGIEEVWRYDQQKEVFIGYRLREDIIGYIGADGYTESLSQAKPFGRFQQSWFQNEMPSLSIFMLLQTNTRIYLINFKTRQVEKLFECADSKIEYVGLHFWHPFTPPRDTNIPNIVYRPLIHCATKDRKHYLIFRDNKEILTIDIPADWRNENLAFAATKTNIFMKYVEKNFRPPVLEEQSPKQWQQYLNEYNRKKLPQSVQLYKIDKAGKFELINQLDWTKPARFIEIPPRKRVVSYISKFSPPVYDLAWYLFEDELLKQAMKNNSLSAYSNIISFFKPENTEINYVLSTALMVFALWHGLARRTSWGKLILWMIIVGAFNLAGFLAYLALNHTPVIRCPVCGKKRGLQRVACIRCGNPLPVPQRKPTDLILAN